VGGISISRVSLSTGSSTGAEVGSGGAGLHPIANPNAAPRTHETTNFLSIMETDPFDVPSTVIQSYPSDLLQFG
jgi:hypothetical protein